MIHLYHGASAGKVAKYLREGMVEAYLTDDFLVACAYTELALRYEPPCEDGMAVLAVNVDEAQLRVDWKSFEDPVGPFWKRG